MLPARRSRWRYRRRRMSGPTSSDSQKVTRRELGPAVDARVAAAMPPLWPVSVLSSGNTVCGRVPDNRRRRCRRLLGRARCVRSSGLPKMDGPARRSRGVPQAEGSARVVRPRLPCGAHSPSRCAQGGTVERGARARVLAKIDHAARRSEQLDPVLVGPPSRRAQPDARRFHDPRVSAAYARRLGDRRSPSRAVRS